MTANTPQHVVFDIGRVLIHYDPHIPFRDIIPDDAERDFFLGEVCSHEWNLEQDRGRSWADAEAEAIARHPDRAEQIRAFRRNWHRMVPHAYEESVAIMLGLIDAGVDVTLLTNFASDTFREAQQRFAFLTVPRGVTVSGEIGQIKPDRAIYDTHVGSFGLDPARTLFIDDAEKNVEGARAAGWQAVHFTSPQALAASLKELGLPVAS
ncbi:HAD family phosphatase [Jiella endophytica]|uniref:HAD family phosphatase n=1 Tax=Jiella endophytica TaxID=2558362 RepID=A0A4Y8RB16_9HYPH|nr:HAD family phosphatase [Jiella endophytica]TFF18057.1 HAD family phosphatase [Jiella endophytica]